MARRRVRDIYGNWVYEDTEGEEDIDNEETGGSSEGNRGSDQDKDPGKYDKQSIRLDWRDWLALTIASLETILLPIVIFIVVVILLVVFLFHF